MCLSVHRGEYLGRNTPQTGTPPRQEHPGQVHPRRYTPQAGIPPVWYTPWAGTPPVRLHPLGRYPPGQVHPWAGKPPWTWYPPPQCMLGYGQQAGGTHPTGMHSWLITIFRTLFSFNYEVGPPREDVVPTTGDFVQTSPRLWGTRHWDNSLIAGVILLFCDFFSEAGEETHSKRDFSNVHSPSNSYSLVKIWSIFLWSHKVYNVSIIYLNT